MQINITRDQALVALDALYERRRTCVEKIGLYASAQDWYMVDVHPDDVKSIEALQDILNAVIDAKGEI